MVGDRLKQEVHALKVGVARWVEVLNQMCGFLVLHV